MQHQLDYDLLAVLRSRLHPALSGPVLLRVEAGLYDDAVFAACKALEGELQRTLGHTSPPTNPLELVTAAFRPGIGRLQDPERNMAEQEGLSHLFRGAFLFYRNPLGHRFPSLDPDEAFDIIVYLNRLTFIVTDLGERA